MEWNRYIGRQVCVKGQRAANYTHKCHPFGIYLVFCVCVCCVCFLFDEPTAGAAVRTADCSKLPNQQKKIFKI